MEIIDISQQIIGVGIGLRACHYIHILEHLPEIAFFEVLTDNYLCLSGQPLDYLINIRSHYPFTMHSVGLSLGSTDPLNQDYIKKLKSLVTLLKPSLISDHLCWISHAQNYFHELLPLPLTEESIKHVVPRIKYVQDVIGHQILIENVSSYFEYTYAEMSEWEFINEVAKQADCYILLDINNIFVNAMNHSYSPDSYLKGICKNRVYQYHLAGFIEYDTHIIDSHSKLVSNQVWDLYKSALQDIGSLPTVVEWDIDIPAFPILENEVKKAKILIDELECKH